MALTFLKETTDWSGAHANIPNHVYIFDGEKCVGYVPHGTNEVKMFSKPSSGFSKKGRKFAKLDPDTVNRLVYGE